MQRFEEVDLAGNVPQIRQLSPITPTRQEKGKENDIRLAYQVQMHTTGNYPSTMIYLLYSFSTKLRKMSLLTVLKDSMTSKGSAWGNFSAWRRSQLENQLTGAQQLGQKKKSNQIKSIQKNQNQNFCPNYKKKTPKKQKLTFQLLLSFQTDFVDGFISWNLGNS